MVPYSTVNTFTERPDLMYQVVSHLSPSQGFRDLPRSIALWGIGGSGKSQLALRFIEKYRNCYDTIIWIDAQTPEAATRSYSEAFGKLKLDYPQHIIDESRNDVDLSDQQGISTTNNWIIHTVKEWLENTRCNWLVVIDNADNLRWIQDIMPKGRIGSLIITSRDRMVYRVVDHIILVDKMRKTEALELLSRSANNPSNSIQQHGADFVQQKSQEHQASLIVDHLGYLALAIDLAGAYISQNDLVQENLSLYLEFLDQNSAALLGNEALQDAGHYHHTVATVWETSFAAINRTSPASALLLTFLAYLSTSRIDDPLFAEASMFNYMHQRRMQYPSWEYLRQPLKILVSLLLTDIFERLMKIAPPFKRHLQCQVPSNPRRTIGVLIALNLASVPVALREYERFYENSAIKEDSETSLQASVTVFIESSSIKMLTWLPYGISVPLGISGVILVWFGVLERYMARADVSAIMILKRTYERIFLAVVSRFYCASETAKEWQLVVAWIVFLFVVLALLTPISFWYMGARNVRSLGVQVSDLCMAAIVGVLILHYFDFIRSLWKSEPLPFRICPELVNSLITTTPNGQWNQRTYSEVLAPLTRYNLIQREPRSAYSMHVLVRWWARNRCPPALQRAWMQEIYRFLYMSYESPTCFRDTICPILMSHRLNDIASLLAAVMKDLEWYQVRQIQKHCCQCRQLLNMILRIRRFLDESLILSSDE